MDANIQIRLNIGDQLQSAIDYIDVKDGQTSFILSKRGINNIVALKKAGVSIPTNEYSLSENILSVSSPLTAGDKLEVIYKFACLSDAELSHALASSGNNINDASVICIDWLLADAAKLFNYSTGDESLSQSDVFEHLKDIKSGLQNNTSAQSGKVPRIYSFKQNKPKHVERDISRWDC